MRPGERRDLLRIVANKDRTPQLGLGCLLVDLQNELARPVPRLEWHAKAGRDGAKLLQAHREVELDPGVLSYQLDERCASPGRREVNLAAQIWQHRRAEKFLRGPAHDVLEDHHHVGVVGVGLVELEHRELWIVTRRKPFVAERPTYLEDSLEPSDDTPFQVQLGGDPQVHVCVKGVVMGDERSRRRPTRDRMQDRRLDLDEAGRTKATTYGSHHLGAHEKDVAHALVGPQVELPLAVADVGIAHAVPLVPESATCASEELPRSHLD